MVILFCLALAAGMGCEKTNSGLPDQSFRIKIIDEICGSAVVQIQDAAFYEYGVNGYVKSDSTYDHVFTTRFSCSDLAKMQTLTADKSGLVVKVKLIKEAQPEPDCVTCAAVVPNAPNRFHLVAFTADWSN